MKTYLMRLLKSPSTAFGIILLGLVIRISVIMTLENAWISGPDAESYVQSGLDLNANGLLANSPPLRTFPIGYAAILSPFLRLDWTLGGQLFLIAQSILFSSGLVWFVLISRRFFDPAIATLFAALASFSPALIDATTSVQYEGILTSLSLALLTVLIIFINVDNYKKSVPLLCLITSLITFVHPRMGLVAIVVIIVTIIRTRRYGSSLAIAAANTCAASFLLIRNYMSTGAAGLSFNLGTNWYLGLPGINNACASVLASGKSLDQSQPAVNSALQDCSISWIMNNPIEWIQLMPIKLLAHFEPFVLRIIGTMTKWDGKDVTSHWEPAASEFTFTQVGDGGGQRWISFILAVTFVTLMCILIAFGVREMLSADSKLRLLAETSIAVIVAVALPSVLFFGMLRFRTPSSPFIILLLVFGVYRMLLGKNASSRSLS